MFAIFLTVIYTSVSLIYMEETQQGGLLQCGLFYTSAKERQTAISSPLKRFQEAVQEVKVCGSGVTDSHKNSDKKVWLLQVVRGRCRHFCEF